MIRTERAVALLVFLGGIVPGAYAQFHFNIEGGAGAFHRVILSESTNSTNTPMYSVGLSLGYQRLGIAVGVYQSKATTDEIDYRYFNPDFTYSTEHYREICTRKGYYALICFYPILKSKWYTYVQAGATKYYFSSDVESNIDQVADEVRAKGLRWTNYNKIFPVFKGGIGYNLTPWLGIFAEGGYDLTFLKAGITVGKIPRAKRRLPNTSSTAPSYNPNTARPAIESSPSNNSQIRRK